MLYNYPARDAATCLTSKPVVFIGDSVTRQLYFQFAHSLDASLPSAPPDDEHKHADYHFTTTNNIEMLFYWDPFLNSSTSQSYIRPPPSGAERRDRPAILVLGSGLWYLRYAASSGGLPAWESTMEATLQSISRAPTPPADSVIILPVEDVISAKLSPDRASTMHASDIDAMNSDLAHRIRPPSSTDPFAFFYSGLAMPPVHFPSVFNQMLHPSQTEDGLHFSDAVVKMQATILMNLRCNDILPKAFPLDKTCCRSYPWPKPLHLMVLAGSILWGPVCWFLARRYSESKIHTGGDSSGLNILPIVADARTNDTPLVSKEQIPILVISASVALIYIADRSGFWLKEQKQFNPWTFAFLSILSLGVGLLTMKRADKDLGFLNRDQTDEWKGWMQSECNFSPGSARIAQHRSISVAILIYHYTGASKISGIYNPIRVLVASYLFMTGYGHMMFYIRKADFGFLRVAQVSYSSSHNLYS